MFLSQSVPTIYAFSINNDDDSILKEIVCCGYHKDQEGDRERAIAEIQSDIQFYDSDKVLIIDGLKLRVLPVNTIQK